MEESKQRRKRSDRGIGNSPNQANGGVAPYTEEVNLEEMTMYAAQKLEAIRNFRRDLKTSLEPVLADLAIIREKFVNKAYVEEGRLHAESGLLMNDYDQYIECLWLDPRKLEQMLAIDETTWQEKLAHTKHLLLNTDIPISHVMQQPMPQQLVP